MKKIDLGQAIGILANSGVIAGILFLGYEIHQNNRFWAAQARAEMAANRVSYNDMMLVPENLSVFLRAMSNEELRVEETARLTFIVTSILVRWESEYREFAAGMYPLETLPIAGYRNTFATFPGFQDVWQSREYLWDPEFVQFMEENVINVH